MKSKKASIPVTLLVILTLALCMFALLSFSMVNSKRAAQLIGYNSLEKFYLIADSKKSAYETSSALLSSEYSFYDINSNPIKVESYYNAHFWSSDSSHKLFEITYLVK